MRAAAAAFVLLSLTAGCGDDPTGAATAGGGGFSGTSDDTTIGPGPAPVASSATTGAGGVNPDDPFGCLQGPPPGRPASIPEGYFPWACWSQKPQCMIWVPTDPGAVIAPVEWEACTAGSPGGDGCRQMTRPWRRGGIGEVGEGFPAVPKLGVVDGELVMKFPRVYVDGSQESFVEFLVAPVEGGPPRAGFRKAYDFDDECGFQDRDFTEGFWVLGAKGQDDVPISDSPEDGLVLIDVAAGTFSLPFRDDTPRDHSWYVSSQAVLRGSGPILTMHDHQFTQEVVVHDAADDPFGAGPANVRTVLGDAAFWDVATTTPWPSGPTTRSSDLRTSFDTSTTGVEALAASGPMASTSSGPRGRGGLPETSPIQSDRS